MHGGVRRVRAVVVGRRLEVQAKDWRGEMDCMRNMTHPMNREGCRGESEPIRGPPINGLAGYQIQYSAFV